MQTIKSAVIQMASDFFPLILLLAAWALDVALGEPKRYHPLVFFGNYVRWLEGYICKPRATRLHGVIAFGCALLPAVPFIAIAYLMPFVLYLGFALLCVYMTMAYRSLREHALDVHQALEQENLTLARTALSKIVSRDTSGLNESNICCACIESVLENGSDAIFGAWFWWLIAGVPGAVIYRLTNTLDAMWGYKTPRYRFFGWAAARSDDLLNYLPARTTALCYCLAGNWFTGWQSWRQQSAQWKSPNAGPVMAAGAGSLCLQLGGTAIYHGVEEIRPTLGMGNEPTRADILRTLQLLRNAMWIWLCIAFGVTMFLSVVV